MYVHIMIMSSSCTSDDVSRSGQFAYGLSLGKMETPSAYTYSIHKGSSIHIKDDIVVVPKIPRFSLSFGYITNRAVLANISYVLSWIFVGGHKSNLIWDSSNELVFIAEVCVGVCVYGGILRNDIIYKYLLYFYLWVLQAAIY